MRNPQLWKKLHQYSALDRHKRTKKLKEYNKYLGAQGHEYSAPIRTQVGVSTESPFWNICLTDEQNEPKSILMQESLPGESKKIENQSGGSEKKAF